MQYRNEMVCWNTPLTSASAVIITSLIHEGSLTITFRAEVDQAVSLICFCFKQPLSYSLKSSTLNAGLAHGHTFKQEHPPRTFVEDPILNLKEFGDVAARLYGEWDIDWDCDRYIFLTQTNTLDVLSRDRPDIRIIASQLRLAS